MKNIFIIAAENSAENYGAQIIDEFRKHDPDVYFFGVGGEKFLQKGVDVIVHNRELSLIGIIEIISHVVKLKRYLNRLFKIAVEKKADVVILIDFPDFNLRIAKKFKKMGIPVYYYISPTVWAWRYSRVKLMKKYVTHTFIVFPFEIDIYSKEKIPFTYTGHPFIHMIKVNEDKNALKKRMGIEKSEILITLLPGSRESEIDTLLPEMINAMVLLKEELNLKVFILKANSIERHLISDFLKNVSFDIPIIDQKLEYDLINASDIVLTTCGASNLEMAILGVPFVAVYRLKKLSYLLGKGFVKINTYSIVNILAQKRIVPELIQDSFNAENMASEIKKILMNKDDRDQILRHFDRIKEMLTQPDSPSEIIYNKISQDFSID